MEHLDLRLRALQDGLPDESIHIYEPTQSYTDANAFIRVVFLCGLTGGAYIAGFAKPHQVNCSDPALIKQLAARTGREEMEHTLAVTIEAIDKCCFNANANDRQSKFLQTDKDYLIIRGHSVNGGPSVQLPKDPYPMFLVKQDKDKDSTGNLMLNTNLNFGSQDECLVTFGYARKVQEDGDTLGPIVVNAITHHTEDPSKCMAIMMRKRHFIL